MDLPAKIILSSMLAGGLLAAAGAGAQGPLTRPDTKRPLIFADPARVRPLFDTMSLLAPLHQKLDPPKPGEWLYENKEPGQTFRQYLRSGPVFPTRQRHVIYVQPLGSFSAEQRNILRLTAEFLGLYYGLEVRTLQDVPLSIIPADARRTQPGADNEQVLTSYVLETVLRPAVREDAFALMALTASDLWPGEGWNFVFGSASLRDRVGVWSLYRNGDASAGKEEFRLCLLRTLKTAAHELGHMCSMLHCTAWRCNMCGSNSRTEADSRPIALCSECLAKLCWATGADCVERYRKLAGFYRSNDLLDEAAFCERAASALTATPLTRPVATTPAD